MEKERAARGTEPTVRRPYEPPRLVRYQRLQEMTRGESPTGHGATETCSIEAQCDGYFNPN